MTPKSGAKNSKKYFLKPIDKVATFCYNIKCSIRWCGSMAEQLICNQQVVGSTPITSSICYGGIPERPKGADCKSVVTDFAGPNPASPTNKKRTFVYQKFSFCLSKPQAWHIISPCGAGYHHGNAVYLITRQRASSCGLMIYNTSC